MTNEAAMHGDHPDLPAVPDAARPDASGATDAEAAGARAQLSVRAARPGDLEALLAFNAAMALETEGRTLDPVRLRRGVEHALADPVRGEYRVAERAGRVVGALLLTREWSDWRDGWFWWVQSVYVAPEARGTGVYRALHESVREQARREAGVCGLRLYVEEHNRRAQEVYAALGMGRTHYLLFEDDFTRGTPR